MTKSDWEDSKNFFSYWKKYGRKKAFARLNYNFIMLETPEQLMKTEITGYIGSIIGTILAIVFLLYYHMWYITIAVAFSLLIQYSGLKGKMQQYKQLKDLKNMFPDSEAIEKEKEGDELK